VCRSVRRRHARHHRQRPVRRPDVLAPPAEPGKAMAAEPPGTPFQPQLERRIRAEWLIVSGVLLVLTMCLTAWGDRLGLAGLDNVLYDQTLTLTTQSSTRDDIAIIAIDDDSLQDIGYWPWR